MRNFVADDKCRYSSGNYFGVNEVDKVIGYLKNNDISLALPDVALTCAPQVLQHLQRFSVELEIAYRLHLTKAE